MRLLYITQPLSLIVLLLLGFAILTLIKEICRRKRYKRQIRKLLLSVTKEHRGTPTERALVIALRQSDIPSHDLYHDLYVKTASGHYTQIDLVALTEVGIIVFEVKCYSGWILGRGYQRQWMQIFNYGKEKHSFYNPVMQNRAHIHALQGMLGDIAQVPYYSIVLFYGTCLLKNIELSPQDGYVSYSRDLHSILLHIRESNPTAYYHNKQATAEKLRICVKRGDNETIVSEQIRQAQQAQTLAETKVRGAIHR